MIVIGAVVVTPELDHSFYGTLAPMTENWSEAALEVPGFSREQTMGFDPPQATMQRFGDWIARTGGKRPTLVSDNVAFDWQFVNWYFHHFPGENPFGYKATDLDSLYHGLSRDMGKNFRRHRQTKHTHNPLDDALGNAEAFLYMRNNMHLRMRNK